MRKRGLCRRMVSVRHVGVLYRLETAEDIVTLACLHVAREIRIVLR